MTAPHKVVVTLTGEAAQCTRAVSRRLGLTTAETVRRGLMLLDFLSALGADEEIVVRNKKTGEVDRVRFVWGGFASKATT